MWIHFFIQFIFFCVAVLSVAAEKLGVLSVDEILLRPYFRAEEGQRGEFGLSDSLVNFSWKKDQHLTANLKLGSQILRNQMIHFSDSPSEDLGLIEAYVQYTGMLGRIRMGIIPLEYGVEGSWQESELIFNRHLLFENRVVSLRDVGVSYYVSHKGFYTQIAVHNGESDVGNPDGRMFLTASWGWRNERNLNLGISSVTGTIKPESTVGVTQNNLAGVDSSIESLWRQATLFLHWHPNKWRFLLEATFGESEQENKIQKYNAGHVDLGYDWNQQWATYLRYDHFDWNERVYGDLHRRVTLAAVVSDPHKTNMLILAFSKNFEQGVEVNNDTFQLSWRVTPLFRKQ